MNADRPSKSAAARRSGRSLVRAGVMTMLVVAPMLGLTSQASARVYDCQQVGWLWYQAALNRDYYGGQGIMGQEAASYWAAKASAHMENYQNCG